ncbi:UDP-forming cellulose synthase catalytic subunit [Acerihabitans arboris]|uniref:Cellulose synthase catalytic subunit [UDP-forming] n=1 Tax=Acerihabitans arboris TaxID=2691583 RepID=A0A845SA88_9GAMM|nr:UDP-forming cellulose synthase catalytic subunit [Acerihabitans arboris]NDL61693.1 UDP-forming cellulose synthase catalytic subunit [Acerihabitans arboris]
MNKMLFLFFLLFFFPAAALVIMTPMDSDKQYVFGFINIAFILVLGRFNGRKTLIIMIMLSLLMSTRYIYWRATTTLHFNSNLECFLGIGLFMAEIYSWVILLLGYLQTSWPLERSIAPLPADMTTWPTVDVYIPTYNESLDVVRDTVLAAQSMDYPADKMNIYILDDGNRGEVGEFAAAAGAGYITRSDNRHAKAGNLNHAMEKTRGELICVFDCDHVATRIFLQATVGSFLLDARLALIQTPHHFYSPDPFERNLSAATQVPNEGALFYGPVQQGNDNWNATFFCGSCAVIRRSALDEIDGFAVETVTEDAHTALKLQRRGWNSAFLAIPMAAGLATERLALHVNQRIRWARGMTQIFRIDNPLFGRGLTWQQRLCYLNAMLHFQYGLPRVVFLTAPLVFLLFNLNIIASSASLIFAYALPHLMMSIYVNSRITGRYRYSFWGEIYETVMAFHLIFPTLLSLISPKLGKFNVTDKGDLLDKNYFDGNTVRPLIIVTLFLALSMIWVAVRLGLDDYPGIDPRVILFNLAWAGYSVLVLLASIAVAKESRQIRKTIRIIVQVPALAHFTDGTSLATHTADLSMGGARLVIPAGSDIAGKQVAEIELTFQQDAIRLPARGVGNTGADLRLEFAAISLNHRRQLVRVVLTRADAWVSEPCAPDRPLRSLGGIVRCVYELFFGRRLFSGAGPRRPRIAGQKGSTQ